MKYTCAALVTLAVAAGTSAALSLSTPATPCAGAKTLSSAPIAVGSDTVQLTTFACDTPSVPGVHAAAADPSVCADTTCTDVCGSAGSLPPTSDDCDKIIDAISIFNNSISPSFTVNSNRAQQLTFGTCRIFLENFNPVAPLTFCWNDFASVATAAGLACFPPVQPVMSEGQCVAPDGLWRVGIAHS